MTDVPNHRWGKIVIRFLFRTQIPVAVAAYLLTVQTGLAAGNVDFFSPEFLIVFFGVLMTYNFPYISVRTSPDFVYEQGNLELQLPESRVRPVIWIISGTFFFILLFLLPAAGVKLLLLVSLLTAAYILPVRWNGERVRSLRNIPVVKNIMLALAWTLATAALPLLALEQQFIPADVAFILAKRFSFLFSLTVMFDIRDMEKDHRNGMKTIAWMLGKRNATLAAISSLAVFAVLSWLHSMEIANQKLYENDFEIPLLISAIFTSMAILFSDRIRKREQFSLWMDSTMIVQFILVVVFWKFHLH